MYARLAVINLGPGQKQTAVNAVDEVTAHAKSMNGFKSITFFADDSAGDYGSFSLWESKADAEGWAEALKPRIAEMFGNQIKGEPTRRLFEVV